MTFTVSGGSLANPVTVVTDSDGTACVPGLLYDSYAVTETVPTGYAAGGLATKAVVVDTEGTCLLGYESVFFSNTPLTTITISVDSAIVGGTASTITCGTASTTTDANGDGTLTLSNKLPGTYNCQIVIDP